MLLFGAPCAALLRHRATSSPVSGPPVILEMHKEKKTDLKESKFAAGWFCPLFSAALQAVPTAAPQHFNQTLQRGEGCLYTHCCRALKGRDFNHPLHVRRKNGQKMYHQ